MNNIKNIIYNNVFRYFEPIIDEVNSNSGRGTRFIIDLYSEWYFNNLGVNRLMQSIDHNRFKTWHHLNQWL